MRQAMTLDAAEAALLAAVHAATRFLDPLAGAGYLIGPSDSLRQAIGDFAVQKLRERWVHTTPVEPTLASRFPLFAVGLEAVRRELLHPLPESPGSGLNHLSLCVHAEAVLCSTSLEREQCDNSHLLQQGRAIEQIRDLHGGSFENLLRSLTSLDRHQRWDENT